MDTQESYALKIPCPFCKQMLLDLHPDEYLDLPDGPMVEVVCHNNKCSFNKHYKTITKEQASYRKPAYPKTKLT